MITINERLATSEQLAQLVFNGRPENCDKDHAPVLLWFLPGTDMKWLVSEIVDDETAYGLCDLGVGFPELGYIHLPDLLHLQNSRVFGIERDRHFEPKHPMSVYARTASNLRFISTKDADLTTAVNIEAA
jgi:Protein of unknown function (DUF2958)